MNSPVTGTLEILQQPTWIGPSPIGFNYIPKSVIDETFDNESTPLISADTQTMDQPVNTLTFTFPTIGKPELLLHADYCRFVTNDRNFYYYITGVDYSRNLTTISVQIDHLVTYSLFENALVTGVLSRRTDVNPNETPFDYPLISSEARGFATQIENRGSAVGFSGTPTQLVSSYVDLNNPILVDAIQVPASGEWVNYSYPNHITNTTSFSINTWGGALSNSNLNRRVYPFSAVAGNIGQAISVGVGSEIADFYTVPSDAFSTTGSGGTAGFDNVSGTWQSNVASQVELLIPGSFNNMGVQSAGLFTIISPLTGDSATATAWELQNSVSSSGMVNISLWADPLPAGRPYARFSQITSLTTTETTPNTAFGHNKTLSVGGASWPTFSYSSAQAPNTANRDVQLNMDLAERYFNYGIQSWNMDREQALASQSFNAQQQMRHSAGSAALDGLGMDTETAQSVTNALYTGANIFNTFRAGAGGADILGNAYNGLTTALRNERERYFAREAYYLSNSFRAEERRVNASILAMNTANMKVNNRLNTLPNVSVLNSIGSGLEGYNGSNQFMVLRQNAIAQDLQTYDIFLTYFGYPTTEYIQGMSLVSEAPSREAFVYYEFEKILNITGNYNLGVNHIMSALLSGVRVWNIMPFNLTTNNKV